MNGENNFVRMVRQFKDYYANHKKRVLIQLLITTTIVTIVIGQMGQSFTLFVNSGSKTSWNPFVLSYYAWIKMTLPTIVIILAINILYIYIVINLDDRLYDKERNFRISPNGTMGTGGFMKEEDKERALIMDEVENINGVILGRDIDTGLICSPKEKLYLNGHKVICGGSGSRKTTTQALNELFQIIKRGESFMTTDPKAEIVAMLLHICKMHGYVTKILNLVSPENSDGIDFVKLVRNRRGDVNKEIEDVQTLSEVIMRNTGEEGGKQFFDDCQKGLLTAAILYVMYDETGRTSPTLGGAYEFLLKNDKTEIDRVFTNLDKSHPAKASYLLYAKTDAKVRDSVIIGLIMRLQVLQSDTIKRIVSEDEIDLTLPSRKKCAYFIVMSDQKKTFDFISSLTFSMFFIKQVEYIDALKTRKAEIPVNLVMDEFPSIGAIPDFSRKLATIRSRRIFITIIFQNFGQIMDRYEKNEWQTIVSNCDENIYLGGNDINETADFYAKRLGEMTVVSEGKRLNETITSITDNRFHPSIMKTEGESNRAVMTEEELMRLNIDHAIVFLKSCRPLEVSKFFYKEHPMSKEIVDINATTHVPRWRIESEGYPNLPDLELSPILEEMDADGSIIEYLRMHKNNKKYMLMDYLHEHYIDRYEVLNAHIRRHKEEKGDNIPEQSECRVQAGLNNLTRDVSQPKVVTSPPSRDDLEGADNIGNLKRFKPLNGVIPKVSQPAAKAKESATSAIKVDASGRVTYETLEKFPTNGKKNVPEPKQESVSDRFAPTTLNEVHANEKAHQGKINDSQKVDANVANAKTVDEAAEKPSRNKMVSPNMDNSGSNTHTGTAAAEIQGCGPLPSCDTTGRQNDKKKQLDGTWYYSASPHASTPPVEKQEDISLPGVLSKSPSVEIGVKKESEDSPDINDLSFQIPEAVGDRAESDTDIAGMDKVAVVADKVKEITPAEHIPIPGSLAELSGDSVREEKITPQPFEEVRGPITKNDFQLFDDNGNVEENKISMIVPEENYSIGMKRQADKKKRGFSKVSPKDF